VIRYLDVEAVFELDDAVAEGVVTDFNVIEGAVFRPTHSFEGKEVSVASLRGFTSSACGNEGDVSCALGVNERAAELATAAGRPVRPNDLIG